MVELTESQLGFLDGVRWWTINYKAILVVEMLSISLTAWHNSYILLFTINPLPYQLGHITIY